MAIWNTATDERLLPVSKNNERTYGLAFAPDGTLLATGGARRDPTLRLWDAESGLPRSVFMGHCDRIWCVAFAPDGRRLATASQDGTIKLWDPAHHAERTVIPSRGSTPTAIGFASGGATLLVDRGDREVSTYDLPGSFLVPVRQGVTHSINLVGFSADGRLLARADGYYSINIHDLHRQREIVRIAHGVTYGSGDLVFSPDGQSLVASHLESNLIGVFRTTTGERVAKLSLHREGWAASGEILISPDGRSIALLTGFAFAIWEPAENRVREPPVKSAEAIMALAYSPDGQSLAASDRSNTIQIHDTTTLAVCSILRTGLGPDIKVIAYSPDGRLLATGDASGTVRLRDIATGETIIELRELSGRVELLRFSPDGAHLAAASPVDGRVVVWHSGPRR